MGVAYLERWLAAAGVGREGEHYDSPVDNVHSYSPILAPNAIGLLLFPHVFAGSRCLQGPPGSRRPVWSRWFSLER